jgi:hypothetical protein
MGLLIAIIFGLVTATPGAHSQCDVNLIAKTLRHIEIADYEPSATSPPPAVVAELYSIAARNVEHCASAAHHDMDSRIRDLLQAATFAKFAASAYFVADDAQQGCSMLAEAERDSAAADALAASADSTDRRMLQASRPNEASIRKQRASKCH